MKFLIDECLMPKLSDLANSQDYEATNIRDLGMLGVKDWKIVPILIERDYILVTHNSKDFRGPNGRDGKPGYLTEQEIHPGLICLNAYDSSKNEAIPMREELQNQLFTIALNAIKNQKLLDLINTVIEIDYDGADVTVTIYEAPSLNR
jgi:predicted nuclease of predicted toxin-antitoxin system